MQHCSSLSLLLASVSTQLFCWHWCQQSSSCCRQLMSHVRLRWWTRRHSVYMVSTSSTLTSTPLYFGIIICSARNTFLRLNLHGCMKFMCREWGKEPWSSSLPRSQCSFSSVFLYHSVHSLTVLFRFCVVSHHFGFCKLSRRFSYFMDCCFMYRYGWITFCVITCCCIKHFHMSGIGSFYVFVIFYSVYHKMLQCFCNGAVW